MKKLFLCLSPFFLLTNVFALEALPKKAVDPKDNINSPSKIKLGKMLYFDKRLSADNTVSCNTCHNANKWGVDSLPTSKGIDGQFGGRNAPTVINAAFLSVQFWDGREPSLEAQAKGPITNPIEMGMKDHDAVIEKIKTIKGYKKFFKKAFKSEDSINIDNVAKAIAAYERTLITPNSPFDKYMNGNKKALSKKQIAGMKTFQAVGCTACHSGPNFSGPTLPIGTGFFQRFPTFADNKYTRKYDLKSDLGRYEHTKKDSDKHMWRVPTLRNIEKTSPYFHNGKVKGLSEAVRLMAKTQLNKDLTKKQTSEIVAFLKALTGKVPYQATPRLPQ